MYSRCQKKIIKYFIKFYLKIQVGSVKGQVRLLSVEGRLRIEKELKVAGDEPGQVFLCCIYSNELN